MDYSVFDKLNERLAGAENENKRLHLILMKVIAGSMLGFFVVLFLVSSYYRSTFPWLSYVKAFSEAAMVGGIADWFAVVALFRNPLGLKIPHTAIIRANKKRIAESLGNFIKSNFLSTSKVLEKVREFDASGKLATFLASNEGAKFASQQIALGLEKILSLLENDKVAGFVKSGLDTHLRTINLSNLASKGLELITRDNAHQSLLDYVVNQLDTYLNTDGAKEEILDRVTKETPSFFKIFGLDRTATEKLIRGFIAAVHEVQTDKEHPLRKRLDLEITNWVERLHNDSSMKYKGQLILDSILSSAEVANYLNSLWSDLSEWLLNDVRSSHSQIRDRLYKMILEVANRLVTDNELKLLINKEIEAVIPNFLEKYRDKIGGFITEQIEGWEDHYMVERLELNVGKDLQFIRISGTLVGGCTGMIIYLVSNWM